MTDTLIQKKIPFLKSERFEPEWILKLRQYAHQLYQDMKWPDASDEEWRRSGLKDYDVDQYEPELLSLPDVYGETPVHGDYGVQITLSDRNAPVIRADESKKISVYSLFTRSQYQSIPENLRKRIEEYFEKCVKRLDNRFDAQHFSVLSDLVVIHFQEKESSGRPVLIEHTDSGQRKFAAPHILVIAEKGVQAVTDVVFKSAGSKAVLLNSAVSVLAQDNAHVKLHTAQLLNRKSIVYQKNHFTTGTKSELDTLETHLGARFVKGKTTADIRGERSSSRINGLYFAGKDQKIDLYTLQDHQEKNAYSRAFYKGVSRDNGYAVYQGLIKVEPGAVKTDAYLTNKNLLLNPGARAHSMPKLKIMNNDVKCSHGSTTGRISNEQIYYLMARGFSRKEAVRLLTDAFFEELLNGLNPFIKNAIVKSLDKKINS